MMPAMRGGVTALSLMAAQAEVHQRMRTVLMLFWQVAGSAEPRCG